MDALRASTAFLPETCQIIFAAMIAAIKPSAQLRAIRRQKEKAARRRPRARRLQVQSELQTFVVFIEFSASVRVLNALLPMTVVVVVVGFEVTTEQCLVEESRTTQYSSASAGVAKITTPKAQMIAFFITSSRSSSRCRTSRRRSRFPVRLSNSR
jgi:hypothetical protein